MAMDMMEGKSNAVFEWTEDMTKCFIQLRMKYAKDFQEGKKVHRSLYKDIATELGIGDKQTPEQIRKKWNNLCKKYKDIKYPGTGTGKAVAWSMYSLMDEALGESHAIEPPLLISSSGGTIAKPLGLSPSPSGSPKPKKAKNNNVLELINDQMNKMVETDQKLVKQQDKMINAFERLVDIFEKRN